jgi:hypothetical protein
MRDERDWGAWYRVIKVLTPRLRQVPRQSAWLSATEPL